MAARDNPGNQWTNKMWRDAVRVAALRPIDEEAAPTNKLQAAATSLVDKAVDGDVTALKEIGDRLDGKVPQAIVGGDDDSKPIRTVTRIELVDLKEGS